LEFAIQHAQQIMNWQENLPKDEMPPRWLWRSDAGLAEWFEEVDRRRESKYNGSDNNDIGKDWEPAEKYEDFSDAREARRMMGLMD
jgi:hypothetical protein